MVNKILSIIVPSYNMEAYLPKCLESLIIDDEKLLERLDIIVVNDGSKDRTSEIAHEFEAKHPNVFRVIDKANGHYGSCINVALPLSAGVYIKVLDADDYVDTKAFAAFCGVALDESEKGDDGADMLVSTYREVMDNGEMKEIVNFGLHDRDGYYTLDEYPETSPRMTIHSIAYRTSLIRDMGYRQTEGICYTDTEWIIEPMSRVRRFRYFHDVVTYYRLGRAGQSVDPVVFARDFQHVADITVGLVRRYARFSSQSVLAARGYYYRQILNMVAMIYKQWIDGYEGRSYRVDIIGFERQIEGVSDFYERAMDFTVGVRHYRYYFVRDWRRWHRRHTLGWFKYKIVMMLAKLYGALRRMLLGWK